MARWMLLLILWMSAAAANAANYWQCEDVDAIRRGPDALAEMLGAEAERCRRTSVRGVDTLNCELARPRSAFGLSAVEVSASIQQAGCAVPARNVVTFNTCLWPIRSAIRPHHEPTTRVAAEAMALHIASWVNDIFKWVKK